MAKAARALESAKILLDSNDLDGASNRAYYAVHDAAKAALLTTTSEDTAEPFRTHSGLIAAFGEHLVKTKRLPPTLGRMLNRAHEIRLIADYKSEAIQTNDAEELIEQATEFLTAIREFIARAK